MSKLIPFIDLNAQYLLVETKVRNRIDQVFEHGQFIMGPEVNELETELKNYTGSKHCITVGNGTDALFISLMALGIGPGDEVITTPFTFAATVECILLLGAKPIYVDIESSTCNINASLIEDKITAKTKAILPVSLFGQTSDMDTINKIAKKYDDIPVIEDAAQSFGSTYFNKKSCNLSKIGCTSFFPSKPLGCYGDGGAIFTNDDKLAKICKEIRIHGQSMRYQHTRLGVCSRLDTLQAAALLPKLELFDWEVGKRLEIGSIYNELVDLAGLKRVRQKTGRTSVFAQYTIFTQNRDLLSKSLIESGIPTAIHYPTPLNEQPAYKEFKLKSDTPIASAVAKQVLSIPMHPYIKVDQQRNIIDMISKFSNE